jgi:hypothetical protein
VKRRSGPVLVVQPVDTVEDAHAVEDFTQLQWVSVQMRAVMATRYYPS